MGNILDYLEKEFATMKEKSFNEVDSLILSEFAYVNFEGVVAYLSDGEKMSSI